LSASLLALFQLRYIKFLISVYNADTYIDNFVYSIERATFQCLFTNIYRNLSRSKRLTRLYNSNLTVDFKYIERRKTSATVLKKILNFVVVFSFASLITSQFDLKSKFLSINLDFLLSLFLFNVQNSDKVTSQFLFDFVAVADHCFID